jgi:hypothetical protein
MDYIGGLFGYLVSQKGANKLIKLVHDNPSIKHGIDYWLYLNFSSLNVFFFEPNIIWSPVANNTSIDSDIQHNYERFSFS